MADVTPIRRLLVANRGEIACRIFRTAHRMGMATVAVYADGDADAPFVRLADQALALCGESAAATYLDAGKLIAAAKRAGADAVHPGYGFLSENADFAQAVLDAGLIWVGPSPDSIRRIGDKLAAKAVAQAAGVPTLQAHALAVGDDAQAAAAQIGYPVLIKASAGGGGRGMRVVAAPDGLAAAIDSARREALAAFGDGTVFLERYLVGARHVEVQLLGDRHGNLVHVFERECSIQRRHQKIIEEAPSSAVDAALRAEMGAAALAVAGRIAYYSTGTAEFLLAGREFFFLEVNTRLQVEHPVTEAITGLDLVREQLRVAEGEALGYTQADLAISGHAIEARLCAEDPARDFLPSPGTVAVWQPYAAPGVRVDAGVEAGSVISNHFDPMIAKVIAHAPTRREAAALLARALERSQVQGLTHNRDFLVACLRSPEFLRGETTTDFIATAAPAALRGLSLAERQAACIAAALHGRAQRRAAAKVLGGIRGGFRNSVMPPERVGYRLDGQTHWLNYRGARDGGFAVTVDAAALAVVVHHADAGRIDLAIDGVRQSFAVVTQPGQVLLHGAAGDVSVQEIPRFPPPRQADLGGGLRAPMPGRVLSVAVVDGQVVARGDLLLVLEAMKMEHRMTAPSAGKVTALRVAAGDQVANGALLVTLEAQEPEHV